MVLNVNADIVLQELVRFYEFIAEKKFLITKKKYYTMVFTRSKKYAFSPEISIGGSEILEEKKEATILGIKVSSSLCWESQVQHIIAKASKTVWTLRMMKSLGVDTATLTQFWRTEGRVHLECQAPSGTPADPGTV